VEGTVLITETSPIIAGGDIVGVGKYLKQFLAPTGERNMLDLYPSHTGKLVPVETMAFPHLVAALDKLRAQEVRLNRMIGFLDPVGLKEFKAEMKAWSPVITPQEMLERTRKWISILSAEKEKRMWAGTGRE
jgi:hypothetical protein